MRQPRVLLDRATACPVLLHVVDRGGVYMENMVPTDGAVGVLIEQLLLQFARKDSWLVRW